MKLPVSFICASLFLLSCTSAKDTCDCKGEWQVADLSVESEGLEVLGIIAYLENTALSEIHFSNNTMSFKDESGNVIEELPYVVGEDEGQCILSSSADEKNSMQFILEEGSEARAQLVGANFTLALEKKK